MMSSTDKEKIQPIQVQRIVSILKDNYQENSLLSFSGWVRTRRDSKSGFSFINLSDGSHITPIQIIADKSLENYETTVLKLTSGCAIEVQGKLISSPAKGQKWEIHVTKIKVLGWVDDPETYPMQPKRHSMEHLREYAHLRPRTNIIGAVARCRQTVANAIHNFFETENFLWVNTPLLTSLDCEGAGEMFQVTTLNLKNVPYLDNGHIDYHKDFFSKPAYLTVSGQLNGEAYAQGLGKIYTFGPTFRSENSNTSRHLAEFWMVEPEVAFADLNDIALLSERLLKHVCSTVLEKRSEDIDFFHQFVDKTCLSRLQSLVASDFVHMEYTEAISILEKSKHEFEFPVSWGVDLASEHERYLTEQHVKAPVILVNYPEHIKSFYMRRNDDGKTVAAMDVLAPGIGEIIGGSQREERYDILKLKMEEKGLNLKDYQWYLDLRRYGTSVHSGFGLGFERLLSYITGISNIRDVIPFPRTPRNIGF